MATIRKLTRLSTILALFLAVLIFVALPAGYFSLGYQNQRAIIATEAEMNSILLSQTIGVNPDYWQYEEGRLIEILSRHITQGDVKERRIIDANRTVIAQSGEEIAPPLLTIAHDLFDSGEVVGQIEITTSLRPLLMQTFLIGIISLFLSLAIFLTLKFFPLRALTSALRSIYEEKEKSQAILNNIPDIAWLKDKESRYIAVNEPFARLCGIVASEIPGKNDFDLFPPKLAEHYRADDQEVLATGQAKELEEPIIDTAGKTSWIVTTKTPICNKQGEVIGTTGIGRDITARKQMEEESARHHIELERMNTELKTLREISATISHTLDMDELTKEVLQVLVRTKIFPFEVHAAIFLVDDGKMRLASFVNLPATRLQAYEEICLGQCLCGRALTTGEIMICRDTGENGMGTLCHPETERCGRIIVPLKAVNTVVGLLSFYTEAGTEVSGSLRQLLTSLGNQIGIAVNNARRYEQTKSSSLHDSLTGLANRRFLEIQLGKGFEAAKRYQEKLAVVMLDIDHFKVYNDSRGHLEGDRLLARLAKVLVKELRDADYIFRYGGEEFLCLLPGTELSTACEVAERLRMAVEAETDVTISLGVAAFTDNLPDKETLVRKADLALYQAKEKGRNRIERSEVEG